MDGRFRLEGPRDGGAEVEYEIVLEPIESRALFAAADPVRLQTDDFRGLGTDDGDGLLLRFLRRTRIRYRVASLLTGETSRLTTASILSCLTTNCLCWLRPPELYSSSTIKYR